MLALSPPLLMHIADVPLTRLKCDRAQPCGECSKRGFSQTCAYATSAEQPPKINQSRQPRKSIYQNLRDRIDQLENLLSAQANSTNPQSKTAASGFETTSETSKPPRTVVSEDATVFDAEDELLRQLSHPGLMDLGGSRDGTSTTWVETDHWAAIMDGISELKASLDESQNGLGSNDNSPNSNLANATMNGPELLIDNGTFFSLGDILGSVPERHQVDRYLSVFFQNVDVASMMFHIPTFLEEYERFWENHEETSLLWLSMLFGIMCMAMLKQDQDQQIHAYTDNQPIALDAESDAKWLAYHYRTKMTQCLKMGNYLKPAPYCIEALLIYVLAESGFAKDAATGIWVLLGIILRLALRLGYHRDPADFPQITPFQGEMRRRIWCLLFSMDSGYANQYGLPRMLQDEDTNTLEPRNLLEEDLKADMTELPPARPDTVRTATQYFVTKSRLIKIRTMVAEVQARLSSLAEQYERVMEIDQELLKLYEKIPPGLTPRPMSRSILDEPILIFQRLHVAIIFNKTHCGLHRRYLPFSTEAEGQKYSYSRMMCLKTAVEVLNLQQILDQETSSGGRLFAIRSKQNALIMADYLFAAMVLCADLDVRHAKGLPFVSDLDRSVIDALRRVKDIWLRHSTSSREARQAHRAICMILGKVDGSDVPDFGSFEEEVMEAVNDGEIATPSVMQRALGSDYDANAPFMISNFDLMNPPQMY